VRVRVRVRACVRACVRASARLRSPALFRIGSTAPHAETASAMDGLSAESIFDLLDSTYIQTPSSASLSSLQTVPRLA